MLYRHDISVAVSRVPAFIDDAGAALERALSRRATSSASATWATATCTTTPSCPGRSRDDAAARDAHDVTDSSTTSCSASAAASAPSTASGQAKRRASSTRYKSALELELMRAIKRTFDPHGHHESGQGAVPTS